MSKAQHEYALAKLIIIFVTWKSLLLFLAYFSPGPGYDTSTALLGPTNSILPSKLVRWDAIYFSVVAHRGYVFEQEWAFGWGYSQLLRLIANSLGTSKGVFPIREAWIGIAVSHVSHLTSVITLYDLSKRLFKHKPNSTSLPYVASILHILSPAGMFLSAPYSEGLFSCLSFLGYYCFARATLKPGTSIKKDIFYLISASFMALAAATRGNGLLNGLLFVHEALYVFISILRHGISVDRLRCFVVIGICGCIIGLGNAVPQYIAYQQFCSGDVIPRRSWCEARFPSIYNFVQAYYWNAGFLKYWTISNLPLFALAVPCIGLFIKSSMWAWTLEAQEINSKDPHLSHTKMAHRILRILALPQIALVVLIASRYHVQIITRLSSGYPVWYWWIAEILGKHEVTGSSKIARATVIWMVMYGIVQGALFASFLPPA